MPPKRQAALKKGGAVSAAVAAAPVQESDAADEPAQVTDSGAKDAECEPSDIAGDLEQGQAECQDEEMLDLGSDYLLVEEAAEGDQFAQEGYADLETEGDDNSIMEAQADLEAEGDDNGSIEAEAESIDQEFDEVQELELLAGDSGENDRQEDVEDEQGDEEIDAELRLVEEMWEKRQSEGGQQEVENGAAVSESDNKEAEPVEQSKASDSFSRECEMVDTTVAETNEGSDGIKKVADIFEAEKLLQTMKMLIKIPRVYDGPLFDRSSFKYCVRVHDVCFNDLQHLRLPLLLAFALTSKFIETARNHIMLEMYTDKKNIKQLMTNLLLSTVFRRDVSIEVDVNKTAALSDENQDQNIPLIFSEHVSKASFTTNNAFARKSLRAPGVNDFHSANLSKDTDRQRSLFLNNLPPHISEDFLMILFPCCLKVGIVKVSANFSSAVLRMKDKPTAYTHLLAFTKFRIDGCDVQLGVVDMSQEDAITLKNAGASRKSNVSKTGKKDHPNWGQKGMSATEAQRKELVKTFSSDTDKKREEKKEDESAKVKKTDDSSKQEDTKKSVADGDKTASDKKPVNDGKPGGTKADLEQLEREKKLNEKQERERREKERKEREQQDRQRREREQMEREKKRLEAQKGGSKRPGQRLRQRRWEQQEGERGQHMERSGQSGDRVRAWQQQQQESFMIDLERELLQQEQELRNRQEREMIEAQMQAQREMKMAREMEMARETEMAREMEMERLRVEQMREMERHREMELQRELQSREEAAFKLRMVEEEHRMMQREREQEMERNRARLRQQEEAERQERERLERETMEMQRQREREAQRMQQRQQEKEQLQQRELELRCELDRQRELEAQRAVVRQRPNTPLGQPQPKRGRFEAMENVDNLFVPNQQQRRPGNSPRLGESRQAGRPDIGLLGEPPSAPGMRPEDYETLERKVAAQREELMRNLALLEKLNKNPSSGQEAPPVFEQQHGMPPRPAPAVREEHSLLGKPLSLLDRQRNLSEDPFDQEMRSLHQPSFKGRMSAGSMQAEPEERKNKDLGRLPVAPHILVTQKSHSAETWGSPSQRYQTGTPDRGRNPERQYPLDDFRKQPGLMGSRPLFDGDMSEHDRLLAVIAGEKKKEPPSATVTRNVGAPNRPERNFGAPRNHWDKGGK